MADVQWVLNRASPDGAELKAEVRRGEKMVKLTLSLPKGWRQRDDISWRVSSWGLRRMAAGGMIVEALSADERKSAGLPESGMALRVKGAGQGSGPHGAATRAGILKGDILTSFGGRDDLPRETDLLAFAVTKLKVGDKVPVTAIRDGKKLRFEMLIQD
jgi:S1-C subfamily serine protease